MLHSVDQGFLISLENACSTADTTPVWDPDAAGQVNYQSGVNAGISINNTDCVVEGVQNWMNTYNRTRGSIYTIDRPRSDLNDDPFEAGDISARDRDAVHADHDNFYTLAGLHSYENGANTSVITALVFTTIAMLLGVLNFLLLLVSGNRYIMAESMFCFCAGFGGLIIVASPWISDVVLNSAGDEFVALPVMVAFQLTLLWVKPDDVVDVEKQTGFGFL